MRTSNEYTKVENIEELIREDKENIFKSLALASSNSLTTMIALYNGMRFHNAVDTFLSNNELMSTSQYNTLFLNNLVSYGCFGGAIATTILSLYFVNESIKNSKQLKIDQHKAKKLKKIQNYNHKIDQNR